MNKKPVLLRSLFALLVLGVFIFSMFPFGQRDYFETLTGMMTNPKAADFQEIVKLARAKVEKSNIYASSAVEEAVKELELKKNNPNLHNKLLLNMTKPAIIKTQKLANNRDVVATARKLASGSIRLGIDLNGGAEFLLKLVPTESKGAKLKAIQDDFARYRDIAIETLRRRIESRGIFESEISPAGDDFISLRVPTISKEEKAALENLIKTSARLSFNVVHQNNQELVAQYLADPKGFKVPLGYKLMHSVEGSKNRGDNIYFVRREAEDIDGEDIVNAFVNMTQFGQREILLKFNSNGAKKFGAVTKKYLKRQLAIILDGNLYSAPVIQSEILGGDAQITGDFSREDSENIANALASGSVPFKFEVQAQYDIEPTIGKDTVKNSLWSGIVGMLLVMIFILLYYRRAGVVADISLFANAAMMVGAVAAFGVTLTLPGIAGIILTIGMAIDSNVLIYERMREELKSGKSVSSAIDLGFDKAFSAIFDSNLTTLFVALILLWQGTGSIKGFAMTLAIGIVTTLFTSVFLTHILFDIMTRAFTFEKLSMAQFIKEPKFNFLKYRWVAIGFSVLLIVVAIRTVAIRGREALGIDFTGGTQLVIDYKQAIPAEKIAKTLAKAGYNAKVNYKTAGTVGAQRELEIICRTAGRNAKAVNQEQIISILNKAYPASDAKTKVNFVCRNASQLGALIGETFTKSAIVSLILAVIGMILYMTIRFQFAYSVAANIALVHDIIIALGLFVLFGGEITLNTIAAALTILGYSVNDTIVNFDRIRENLKLMKNATYTEIINASLNNTLSRTILTSLTTLMVLFMQLIFGGSGIRDFVAVMILGVIVGWYSSTFISSVIIDYWHRKTKSELTDAAETRPNV